MTDSPKVLALLVARIVNFLALIIMSLQGFVIGVLLLGLPSIMYILHLPHTLCSGQPSNIYVVMYPRSLDHRICSVSCPIYSCHFCINLIYSEINLLKVKGECTQLILIFEVKWQCRSCFFPWFDSRLIYYIIL